MRSHVLVLISHVSLPKSPSSAMVFRHKTPTLNQGCKRGKINETSILTKWFYEGVILKTLLFLVAGIIYVINYFLLKLHNYIACKFCGDKYRLTDEEKKITVLSAFFFFPLAFMCFHGCIWTEYCITNESTAECKDVSVHPSFAKLGSGFSHSKTSFQPAKEVDRAHVCAGNTTTFKIPSCVLWNAKEVTLDCNRAKAHRKKPPCLLLWVTSFPAYWAPLISIKGGRDAESLGCFSYGKHISLTSSI